MSDISVQDNTEKHRYDIFDGDAHAGFSVYKDFDGGQRIFFHTKVFDEFGGKGLAGILTRAALGATVAGGRRIVPVCPYVVKWVEGHDDFADSVDAATQEHIDAVKHG